jgi:lipoprotein-anchoring transpeptidase ErfK/SrfK
VRSRILITVLTAGALVLGVAACGGGGAGDTGTPAETAAPTTTQAPAASGTTVARATGDGVAVFADVDDTEPVLAVPGTSPFGFRQSFLVLDDQGDSLRVLVPGRPNGSTGWIRRADVELQTVDYEIDVDLEARTLTLRLADDTVLETPIAIGAPDAPTPTGRFFVTDLLETGDPEDDYGPFAAGLSGYSKELTEFAGGDGQIGIHGTNDPASIGQAVSHGCVRVPNDVITTLATTVPIGTPVTIH